MRISFDVDGVLANFEQAVVDAANLLFGAGKVPEGYVQTTWYWEDIFEKWEWDRIWQHLISQPNLWLSLQPFKENMYALCAFMKAFPDVETYFITSRVETPGDSALLQTATWLRKHGVPYAPADIIVAKEKAVYMEQLGIAYSIDDLPSTVKACNEVPGHKALLLHRDYNASENLPRVHSVAEFLEVVENDPRLLHAVHGN